LREGKVLVVNSETISPGDILLLEAGDYVVADSRILVSHQLTSDESTLTGESLSVEKHADPVHAESSLGDRKNMLFASTVISSGTAKAIVVTTGKNSEIGKIAKMIDIPESQDTPLQIRLEAVSSKLLMVGIFVIGLVFIIGIIQGRDLFQVLLFALSLAVAAIPEGLPTVVTIALVMAVHRMSKKKALMRRLDSVETLGATDIICTDKTGTLTTGKMKVRESFSMSEDLADKLIHCMVLCNNASLDSNSFGDTTELALLLHAQNDGVDIKKLQEMNKRLYEWSFDSKRKRMSVASQSEENTFIFVKGAPESVFEKCRLTPEQKIDLNQRVSHYSQKGMRLLAFAYKKTKISHFEKIDSHQIEQDLEFLGLVAMADPPREETGQAIRKCQISGIRIIMITGDHPETASAIAFELGIIKSARARVVTGLELDKMSQEKLLKVCEEVSVYARVSPENKLNLVNALKKNGHIVAMTGDGVNDAPALKSASIGVAMGLNGTDVARQAASMVLTDDNFSTIVDAVEEGRGVNGNIKRTLQYLLSTNLAELLFILGATIVGWPIPLLPINILWVNLVTDGLPSLALAAEKVPPDYLLNSHRPSPDSFFDKSFYWELILVSVMISGISLGIYYYSLNHFTPLMARSISFSFLVYVVLLRSCSCRSFRKTFFEIKPNFSLLLALTVPLAFQISFQEFDFLLEIFKVSYLPLNTHLILVVLALIPVTLVEIHKIWSRK
jgi:Ca2+-transporting ATPase